MLSRKPIAVLTAILAAFGLAVAVAGAAGPAPTATVATTANSITLGSLNCDTHYRVRLQVINPDGTYSSVTTKKPWTKACPAPPPPPPPTGEPAAIAGLGYHQVFGDEFDTLDRSTWDDHIWYDDPPDPAWTDFQTVENGVLHLRSSRNYHYADPCTGDKPEGAGACNWPINTVTTLSSGHSFQYGYFEARLKWTGASGAWPGFWLYSTQHSLDDAQCAHQAGEIDAMEGQGVEPNVLYGTVHSNTNGCTPDDVQNDNNYQEMPFRLADSFHTYGVLWTPTEASWYVDDKLIMSAPTYATDNQPMYLLLQMWIDGWSPPPDASTPDVLETDVDWIHVWQQ